MRNNIKKYREQSNLTFQELADMYGGTKSHIWALEKGTSSPTLPTAYAMAKVLNVTVYDLWPDETEIIEETIIVRRIKITKGAIYGKSTP